MRPTTPTAMLALALALATLLTPAGAAAQATIGGDWRSDVASFSRDVVDAGLTPGMAVAITIGDWVAWAEGFGMADVATGRPATGDTPFYIASSTKSLTAAAALIAAHRGELDLDAPMTRYLPDARLPDGVPRDRITVHDLAALTHGISGNGPVVFRTAYTGEFSRDQLLDLLGAHGTTTYGTFDYNNLGFNLLGLVLEAVYDASWKDVVERLVTRPLGMRSTSPWLSRLGPDDVARPHVLTGDGWDRTDIAKDDANLHAAGGHFASAHDLARYLAAHITDGVVEGERRIEAGPLRATHRQQVAQDGRFGPFPRHGWGYGWDLGSYGADTLVHRFGGFGGYRSHMSFMPRHGIGVVVLVNGNNIASPAADLVATYVYERMLDADTAAVRTRFAARMDTATAALRSRRDGIRQQLAERAARLAPLPHPLEHYAGTYESPTLGRMEWRVVAGGLELGMGVIRSRAEVFDAAGNQLRFEAGGSGQVAEFVFPEGGGPATAVRMAGVEFGRVDG
jgi:CubicO group peptidase (beta-lactamase class C family)